MKKSHRNVRFAIFWFNRSRSYQSKSVQYHDILTIEGEIALLYHSTAKIGRQYIIKELTGKKICMRCALSISRKRIINSAIFSISHQDRF